MKQNIFITGGSGYIGRHLIPELRRKGHGVRALVRRGSERNIPAGCEILFGNALDPDTFRESVHPTDTFVHLVGVAHPGPSKGEEFRTVDLASIKASVDVAQSVRVKHFVYLSVAQPAPIMKEYTAVRSQGETLLKASGLNATFVRPWYVLGPGHRWPYVFLPLYSIARALPPLREGATRLGLVTIRQMTGALLHAIENSPNGVRVMDVETIRSASLLKTE